MKSGYKIFWTNNALEELRKTIDYLQQNFSDKEVRKLAIRIESATELISQNPWLFPKSEFKNTHQVFILKFNTMYYKVKNEEVQIVSFFSNRQNPKKRKV
ncbi:MAG: type II toxin-antitoxin system RelE/ParE family toxin [Bacteroidia bacterium]